jgi:hypothetical protein
MLVFLEGRCATGRAGLKGPRIQGVAGASEKINKYDLLRLKMLDETARVQE